MVLKTKYSIVSIAIGFWMVQGCTLQHQITQKVLQKEPYFTGLVVYDPSSNKTIVSQNPHHYFTPASTIKIFTLYTALHYLNDSIATFSFYENDSTLFVKPLADPSFLHDSLSNSSFAWLKKQTKAIHVLHDTFEDYPYGEGWQWDDYPYYFMPEKSLFPLYANLATIQYKKIIPQRFQNQVAQTSLSTYYRDFYTNQFYIHPNDDQETARKIPFKTDLALSVQLLSDTLQKPVILVEDSKEFHLQKFKSTPTFPLYKRLMDESENFMAEQLFLIIAKEQTDSYIVKNTIDLALNRLFQDIPDDPRWVDASGLSRYNLFTPQSMVYVLDKLVKEKGFDEVKKYFPHNGSGGKLQKWYPAEKTYLYAKTGSVSNNHSLCGYLVTKKGKVLIFSYMNNNYRIESKDVRATMNQQLQMIYEQY